MNTHRKLLIFLLSLCSLPVAAWAAGSDLSQLVGKAEHVILLRHARAPGTGDPPNFRLGDCSTQRNLSKAGRDQAARIGARLRAAGLASTTVYSSQWCRCLDTARNLAVGPVVELPVLNSFFQSPELEQKHTRPLRSWIASADLSRPIVLVTHQVNITALTGIFPAEGETLILRRERDKLSVVARIPDN
jgi:broad specificity phosphatase PhoE